MIRGRAVLWIVGFVAIGLTGCSSARYVLRDSDRGIVAIPANTNMWPWKHRDDADRLMNEHFPGGYQIDRELEEVVGKTTTTGEDTDGQTVQLAGGLVTLDTGQRRSASTTTDVTEYRIEYHRAERSERSERVEVDD
jgi:hypothetical protein